MLVNKYQILSIFYILPTIVKSSCWSEVEYKIEYDYNTLNNKLATLCDDNRFEDNNKIYRINPYVDDAAWQYIHIESGVGTINDQEHYWVYYPWKNGETGRATCHDETSMGMGRFYIEKKCSDKFNDIETIVIEQPSCDQLVGVEKKKCKASKHYQKIPGNFHRIIYIFSLLFLVIFLIEMDFQGVPHILFY